MGECAADSADDSAGHRGRLRERLFEGGGKALLDHERVEYLLVLTIRRIDTKPLAKRLISQFGGVGQLLGADAATLKREGLSDATVAMLPPRRLQVPRGQTVNARQLSAPMALPHRFMWYTAAGRSETGSNLALRLACGGTAAAPPLRQARPAG